jgi:ESCRT-I complex subunit TSG101
MITCILPMTSPGSLTQRWLQQNIVQYPFRDRVYSDINSALERFLNLRPKSDVYSQSRLYHFSRYLCVNLHATAYDDGRTQLLICIHGLLPISYRQASYNIPIAVWIARDFPREPPIVYVVPTSDMLVKAGKHLEVSGRCRPEYIQLWERKSEVCLLSRARFFLQNTLEGMQPCRPAGSPAGPIFSRTSSIFQAKGLQTSSICCFPCSYRCW